MATPQFPPHGVYGPNQDGLLDPQKATLEDRQHKSTARLAEERADSELMSPFIAAMRASSAAALADAAKPRPAVKPRPVFVATRSEAAKG
jgi:hypothetical protein